jgi:hypothetical protein
MGCRFYYLHEFSAITEESKIKSTITEKFHGCTLNLHFFKNIGEINGYICFFLSLQDTLKVFGRFKQIKWALLCSWCK